MKRFLLLLILPLVAYSPAQELKRIELDVEGTAREALVYAPADARQTNAPLVFVWHGHGGNMNSSARGFSIHTHWPQAICVYPQGLNTPGRLTDPEGKKPGWQSGVGMLGDRDLKFFDALLAKMKSDFKVDAARIYSTGHSNGGGFTYLLWAARGEVLAAVAPSAAILPRQAGIDAASLKPKPAMHLAGETDPLVKFDWQKSMMETVKKVNGCENDGKAWSDKCLIYQSKTGTPFVSFIHAGGHQFVPEAPALIVRFFKEHSLMDIKTPSAHRTTRSIR